MAKERCRTCGKKVKVQIQKNTGYCSAQHQEEGDVHRVGRDLLLARYRELQNSEAATIEGDKILSREWGKAWRAYVKACKKAGVTPESPDSPDLGRW